MIKPLIDVIDVRRRPNVVLRTSASSVGRVSKFLKASLHLKSQLDFMEMAAFSEST